MFNFVNFRLKFPSILIIYQDVIISICGTVVIIGFADRQLFCTSDDLIESYSSKASPFCTFTGINLRLLVYIILLVNIVS